MNHKLEIDNPFFNFMGELADVAIINILFLLCSFPVITMGASMAAKYEAFRKMRDGRMASPIRCFFTEFRVSLKRTLPAWMVQLLTGCLLIFDLMVVTRAENILFWHVVGMVLGCLLLLWMMVSCYLLPAAVYKDRSVKAAVSESFLLAVRNLPLTLAMTVISGIPAVCFLLGSFFLALAAPIYLVIGFGAAAYVNTLLLEKCSGMVKDQVG